MVSLESGLRAGFLFTPILEMDTMAPHPSASTRGSAPSTTTALLFALVLGLLLYAL